MILPFLKYFFGPSEVSKLLACVYISSFVSNAIRVCPCEELSLDSHDEKDRMETSF